MCTECGDDGNAQFRHKRVIGCAVFVSSIVAGDTRYEPQLPADRSSPPNAPLIRHEERGDTDIGGTGTTGEAKDDSKLRRVGTGIETQAYSGGDMRHNTRSERRDGRRRTESGAGRWAESGSTMSGKRDEKKTKIGYLGNFESDTLSVTVID